MGAKLSLNDETLSTAFKEALGWQIYGFNELDQERYLWQRFLNSNNNSPLFAIHQHLSVRFRHNQQRQVLQLYASGRVVIEASEAGEFRQQIMTRLETSWRAFLALSEAEKTKTYLSCFGIKLDFTKKSQSYFVQSKFWILSKELDFRLINQQLAQFSNYFLMKHLPYLFLTIVGSQVKASIQYHSEADEHLRLEELTKAFNFKPAHELIDKLLTHNELTKEWQEFTFSFYWSQPRVLIRKVMTKKKVGSGDEQLIEFKYTAGYISGIGAYSETFRYNLTYHHPIYYVKEVKQAKQLQLKSSPSKVKKKENRSFLEKLGTFFKSNK